MEIRSARSRGTLRVALLFSLLFLPVSEARAEAMDKAGEGARFSGTIPHAPAAMADGEEVFFFYPRLQVSVESAHGRGGQTPVVFLLGLFDVLFSMDSSGQLNPAEARAGRRGDPRLRLDVKASRLCLGSQRLPIREISRTDSRTRLAVEETDLVAWLRLNRARRRAMLQIGEWRMPLLLVDRPGAAAGAVILAGPALLGQVPVPLTGAGEGRARDSGPRTFGAHSLFRYLPHRSQGADRGPR